MNLFRRAIEEGSVSSERDLRLLYRKLAKRMHPDVSGPAAGVAGHERFIHLKADYDRALRFLAARGAGTAESVEQRAATREECIFLFKELMASNFPVDRGIRNANRMYRKRIRRLNEGLSDLDRTHADLFLRFERELYALRGKTAIMNQPYILVKLYLYRFSDYVSFPNGITKNFLIHEYGQVQDIFRNRNMDASAAFLDWLVEGTVPDELRRK